MKKFCILTALLIAGFSAIFAQESPKELPYSFTHRGISYNIDEITLPTIDNEALLNEDAQNTDKFKLLRVGVGHDVQYSLTNCGRTDIMSDGSKLWRVKFESKDAIMMNLIMDNFNIPEEGKLFIYTPDHEQVYGPYTNKDVQEVGRLSTDDIIGEELIAEYYEPADASFNGEFRILCVTHVYKDFLHVRSDERGPHGSAEGNCHIDVVCPIAADWRAPINSVVCISITAYVASEGGWGMYICSGAMVNNVRMDKTPYVLSANHCVAAADQTHKFYFNYQTALCGGTTGTSNYAANGGVIVARSNENSDNYNSSSDFLLLRITGNIGVLFRDSIVFAGWDRSGAASIGAGIHHPGGDWKKISFPKSVTTVTTGNLKNKYFEVHWQSNPNRGVTEEGSSGSPLFNNHSLIIGTLTAGSSSCSYTNGSDLYGRLAYHWNNNGATADNRKLQPWLDPDNTGTTVLKGMRYDGSVITGIEDHKDAYETFSVAPNPVSSDYVTINGNFLTENAVCNIYNTMGQLVMTKEIETSASFQMNVTGLTNGVYFVEIQGSERNYKSKIIISR